MEKCIYIVLFLLGSLVLGSCEDDCSAVAEGDNQKNVIQLSIVGMQDVQVRGIASEWQNEISFYTLFVYRGDNLKSTPVYYQDGNSRAILGNSTASPLLKFTDDFTPQTNDRVYVLLNASVGNSSISEEDLQKAKVSPIQGLSDSGNFYMCFSGSLVWKENASNLCVMDRRMAAVTVNLSSGIIKTINNIVCYNEPRYISLFNGDDIYTEVGELSYAYTLSSLGISSAETLISEYRCSDHTAMSGGKTLQETVFSPQRMGVIIIVEDNVTNKEEYYRLDFYDKVAGKYIDVKHGCRYTFNISSVRSDGYSYVEDAVNMPGSNLEYTVSVDNSWTGVYEYNGQYQMNFSRGAVELLSEISDPVSLVNVDLYNNDSDEALLDKLIFRSIRVVQPDKETTMPTSNLQLWRYDEKIENVIKVDNNYAYNDNRSQRIDWLSGDIYSWKFYCTTGKGFDGGYLEVKMGNMTRYIPISEIGTSNVLDEEGTSNCYIVSPYAGKYSFDATVMGVGARGIIDVGTFRDADDNLLTQAGGAEIHPKSAKLIWQDMDGLITQVAFNSTTNRVEFVKGTGSGNALIAVYDDNDPNAENAKCLWSWHIWCTEQPEEQKYVIPTNDRTYSGKQYYVLDRNLGATSVQTNSIKSVGLHYQWGRKDPMIGKVSLTEGKDALVYNVRDKQIELENVVMNPNVSGLQYAIQNPEKFIECILHGSMEDRYNDTWIPYSEELYNLWGVPVQDYKVEAVKTIYDPCPLGYMVPQTDFAASFYKSGVGSELDNLYYDSSMSYENNMGYCFYYDAERRKKAYYPATSAKVAKNTFYFLTDGYYWTSCPQKWATPSNDGSMAWAECLMFTSSEIELSAYTGSWDAVQSVRCVRE